MLFGELLLSALIGCRLERTVNGVRRVVNLIKTKRKISKTIGRYSKIMMY